MSSGVRKPKLSCLQSFRLGSTQTGLCSDNKGADQLCIYWTAYLQLCFSIDKIRFSHDVANIVQSQLQSQRYLFYTNCFESTLAVLCFKVPYIYLI